MLRRPLFIALLTFSTYSMAANELDCSQFKDFKPLEIKACLDESNRKQASIYEALVTKFKDMPEQYQITLKRLQSSWLQYRTDECNLRLATSFNVVNKDRLLHICQLELNLEHINRLAKF